MLATTGASQDAQQRNAMNTCVKTLHHYLFCWKLTKEIRATIIPNNTMIPF